MSDRPEPRPPTITEEVYLATIKMHVARIEALEAEAEEHGHQIYAYANRLEEVDNAMVDAMALIKAQATRLKALEAALREIASPVGCIRMADARDVANAALALEEKK